MEENKLKLMNNANDSNYYNNKPNMIPTNIYTIAFTYFRVSTGYYLLLFVKSWFDLRKQDMGSTNLTSVRLFVGNNKYCISTSRGVNASRLHSHLRLNATVFTTVRLFNHKS
jgi:hypothetical protein